MHPTMTIIPLLADAEKADNIWTALPTMLWVGLALIAFLLLRPHLIALLFHLTRRLRSGASCKIWELELGSVRVVPHPPTAGVLTTPLGIAAAARATERDGMYAHARGVMLVHRLFRSDTPGQHYDMLIYVIPHKSTSFASVAHVEYFLGSYWGNEIFTATDRAHGFPLRTSAYGPFLCTAHVHFTDRPPAILSRYIDFEMGQSAPFVENDAPQSDD